LTRPARRLAVAAGIAGLLISVGRPRDVTLGPEFTVPRNRIVQTADSMLRARGGDPARWTRLTTIDSETRETWPVFLEEHDILAEAQRLASSYEPPTWWEVRYIHTAGTTAERAEEWAVYIGPDGWPLETRHILPDSARRDSVDSTAVRRIAAAALARDRIDASALKETEYRERARPARLDVRVTYTDTTVKLPAGAAARVWIVVAGNEALGVRRGVELPEAFLRAYRASQTNRMMVGAVAVLLLVGFMITGGIIVKGRLAPALHDKVLDRRTSLRLIGGLFVLATISSLNSLPSELASYETTQPWNTFLGTTAVGFLEAVAFPLILVGLLHVLDALRRRLGIPMMPAGSWSSARTEVLILGLGLGSAFYATTGLGSLLPASGIPPTPWTYLDEVIPFLGGVTDVPASAIGTVSMAGIPILIVAGLTRRRTWQALIAVALVTLVAAITWSFTPTDDGDPYGLALLAVAFVVAVAAISVWGVRSAWAWFVAALFYEALGGLRYAVYGPEWQARMAGGLTVLAATLLIALILRRGVRAAAEQPAR
jgi:hypothetical protein